MKPRYYRSVSSKGASRPRLMHHHKGGWNEMKWIRWVWRNGGMKFVVGENGRNPVKNLPRPHFAHHETYMEWPRCKLGTPAVGGEHLTACATRPPYEYNWFSYFFIIILHNLTYYCNFCSMLKTVVFTVCRMGSIYIASLILIFCNVCIKVIAYEPMKSDHWLLLITDL